MVKLQVVHISYSLSVVNNTRVYSDGPGIFFSLIIKKLKLYKFNKNRISYINHKKKKNTHKDISLTIYFLNFLILKSLHDSLIINATNYIFFKILVS